MAVDAGLGEISRMGYVITKEYGPRVRLGGVTTDLPLVPDRPVDIGVEDFCTICKKCARCCPSRSIPRDEPKMVNGTLLTLTPHPRWEDAPAGRAPVEDRFGAPPAHVRLRRQS
ncbi:MAG: hypothetical protein SCH98_05575 [Deferrisomatales bacterium]|nr:hypothetical protein [Deferrisomatales bacterium]